MNCKLGMVIGVLAGASYLPTPVCAQGRPLTVTGVRGVTFGLLLPGVPLVVSRNDPANSGEFDIRASRGQALLVFVLPVTMTGPAGALLPLTFSANDAGYSANQAIGSQVGFDPRQPFTAAFPPNGRAAVFLGATATPAANQRAGAYAATITLSVMMLP